MRRIWKRKKGKECCLAKQTAQACSEVQNVSSMKPTEKLQVVTKGKRNQLHHDAEKNTIGEVSQSVCMKELVKMRINYTYSVEKTTQQIPAFQHLHGMHLRLFFFLIQKVKIKGTFVLDCTLACMNEQTELVTVQDIQSSHS